MRLWFEKVFGVNFRTSLTGAGAAILFFLSTLAALPFTIGESSVFIPPKLKEALFWASGVAALILKVWNSFLQKDKAVSGNAAAGWEVATSSSEMKEIKSSSPELTIVKQADPSPQEVKIVTEAPKEGDSTNPAGK